MQSLKAIDKKLFEEKQPLSLAVLNFIVANDDCLGQHRQSRKKAWKGSGGRASGERVSRVSAMVTTVGSGIKRSETGFGP